MPTIDEALTVAVEHHQAGRLHAAEQIYRQILAVAPNQPDALHLLGVVANQSGQHEAAIGYIGRAIAAHPSSAIYHNSLGEACRAAGRPVQAMACYRRAIELATDFADAHNNLGTVLSSLGQGDEAIVCYRRAVELEPAFAEAHNNLGNALKEQGELDLAIDSYAQALAREPHFSAAQANLAGALQVLKRRGKLDAAIACYRRVMELTPDHAPTHNNLGVALNEKGLFDEAAACCRHALKLKPDFAEAHYNLANALKNQGQFDAAIAGYRRAIELKPGFVDAYNNLGIALSDQRQFDAAIAAWRQAVTWKADFAEAHNNLGNALKRQGQLDAAAACYRRAIELKPDLAEAYYNLGDVCRGKGQFDEAIACYQQAVTLKPDYADAHNNLGITLGVEAKFAEALACYQRASELTPQSSGPHNNRGNTLKDLRQLDAAIASYRRALELKPEFAEAHSNLLLALHYQPGVTLAELATAHAEFERQHAAQLAADWSPHGNDRNPGRRLRLGIVSLDLRRHPVGHLMVRAIENLDPSQCEVVCYSHRAGLDAVTDRLRAAAVLWRESGNFTDDQLARQIRDDQVDILVDLAGHTAGNRLLVFARRPAPIQITWLGYLGTTGLRAMDYLLADRCLVPSEAEPYYTERVLRMPHGYVCYDAPVASPEVGPLPAIAAGRVTFCSFNNPSKIGPEVIAAWAAILRRVPRSRLVLKYRGLEQPALQAQFQHAFQEQAVEPDRVELLGASAAGEYLASYHTLDIALDPFPFGGGVTTCDALWMGLPVITCPGETFASRHGLSHLSNVGLRETIARDLDDYVERAVELAADLPRLAAIRAGLRAQMAASPLCDGPRFAADLTALLRNVWRDWCAK
jgi:predicted O-linked N-acetylglucosamine transferase (SPINDLY family)